MSGRTVLEYAIEHEIPCDALTIEQQGKELEQLRGECAALRETLKWITDCWGRDEDDYCRADMQSAIDNGRQTLASSSLSEKYADVVRLSTELREAMTATEASSGLSEWSLIDRENCLFEGWKTAVDTQTEEATK